ncbi:MAG: hypothetical protein KJ718_04265 [Nanoarchaeota archaeon]|nr:hypothetical protein [Nanoarchaeota archaeon]
METPTDPKIEEVLMSNEETIIRLTEDISEALHVVPQEANATKEKGDYLKPSNLEMKLVGVSEKNQEQIKRAQAAIVDAVLEVFKRMDYKNSPPESINISSGALLLPSGEDVPACYGYNEKGKPGRIYVSVSGSKVSFAGSLIPDYVAAAAFAAHEAVEHVNNMQGTELLTSQSKIPSDVHREAATEKMANETARKIIQEKYGWTVHFGDEQGGQK